MSNFVHEKVFLRGVLWFARLKSGDFGLEDEERPGQPKKFEDEELEALHDDSKARKLGST